MKTQSPQFTEIMDWIDYLQFVNGRDYLSVNAARQLYQALSRAENNLGAILGYRYEGIEAGNKECLRAIRLMNERFCIMPSDSWTGVVEARLKLIRQYAPSPESPYFFNQLTNSYECTSPTTHPPCLHGLGRPRNDEPVAVPV